MRLQTIFGGIGDGLFEHLGGGSIRESAMFDLNVSDFDPDRLLMVIRGGWLWRSLC